MAYVIKVNHADTLRRLTFEKQPGGTDGLSYRELEGKIREIFQFPVSAQLKVTYTDKDHDVVTMETDQDLKDACVYQSLNPLRLKVVLATPPTATSTQNPDSGRSNTTDSGGLGPEQSIKEILKKFKAETVKNMVQAYEPLFKDVKSPAQIPELMDKFAKLAASQFGSLGVGASSSTPSPPPPSSQSPLYGGVPQYVGMRNTPTGMEPIFSVITPSEPVPSPDWTKRPEAGPHDGSAHAQNESSHEQIPHWGVTCDICGMNPIQGTRFKSLKKVNYDLCPTCFGKLESGEANDYHRIDRPAFRPRHFRHPKMGRMNMCPMMGPVAHGGKPWSPPDFGMRGPQDGQGCRPGGGRTWHPHWDMRAPHDYHQKGKLDARFVRDVSIFDGTELAPGTRFTKIWRLRNTGPIPWPSQTKLVQVDGDDLGSATITPLEIGEQGLAPEEEMEVSVDCVAPQQTGRFVSHYRLATPWGPKFGHRIWVQIQVVPVEALNRPAEVVVADVANVEAAETIESHETPADVIPPLEEETPNTITSTTPSEVKSRWLDNVSEQNDNLPSATETVNNGSDNDESFVKVDVNRSGDDDIQIIEEMTAPPVATQDTSPIGGITEEIMTETTAETPATAPADELEAISAIETEGNEKVAENVNLDNPLLGRLEAMGFTDRKLNQELLEANSFDLRKTVDDLCSVDDWAPALAELEEMGFNDADINRRLMFKNKGNVKRVVKELVQLAKESAGRTN